MQCDKGEESGCTKIIPLFSKQGRKESTKERAGVTGKGFEGDEQCGDAERMDVTVV